VSSATATAPLTLLETKLQPPRVRSGLVPREELVRRLNALPRPPLVLLSAPAGSGKTTLLAKALADRRRIAWLQLEEADDEPTRFWTYVLEALARAALAVGARSQPLLQAPGTEIVGDVLPCLVNELAGLEDELAFVLDDFHLVPSPEIAEQLAFLLDYLPANVQLVLATRADPNLPLARLRARAELLELRLDDLRFDVGRDGRVSERFARTRARRARRVAPARADGRLARRSLPRGADAPRPR
jgi:LuxR family maltose regulon positive regulatory protein